MFVYEPIDLDRPAFRLLHLLKGKWPDIECTMYQAYLDGDDIIPYDALSYTWGGTDKTSTVIVNGKYLDVTANLYSALRHLRSETEDKVLWVDAICIDQNNKRERGHQVQQMCKIYSQAEKVIVWLGQATRETDLLLESLQRLENLSTRDGHGYRYWELEQWTQFWLSVPKNPDSELRYGLGLLLSRPWFRRVWILQEIANAKKASILCGTKSVRAHTFALAPSLIGIKPERHCRAVLDIMPGSLREKTWWAENRDLYNLLLKFSESEASDPRDKVYALLGISSDAQDTDSLRPDYRKGLHEVIQDTSSFLFGPRDVKYGTMPDFLANLTSRSVTTFVDLAKMSDVNEVDHFLKRRGLEVPLSEDMIEAAAANEGYGLEIMSLLLRERGMEFTVTEKVVRAAAGNRGNWQGIMSFLLQYRRNEFTVTKGVIEAARGNTTSTMDIINFLLQEFEETIRSIVVEELTSDSRYQRAGDVIWDNISFADARRSIPDIVREASLKRIRTAVEMLLPILGADVDMERMERVAPLYVRANVDMEEKERVAPLYVRATAGKEGRMRSYASEWAQTRCRQSVVRLLLEPSASSIPSWTRAIAGYLRLSPRRPGT